MEAGGMHKIALVVWFVAMATAAPEALMKYCGSNLSKAVSTACNGNYYEPGGGTMALPSEGEGIVDECCHHGCTKSMLRLYCNDAGTSTRAPGTPIANPAAAGRITKVRRTRGRMCSCRRRRGKIEDGRPRNIPEIPGKPPDVGYADNILKGSIYSSTKRLFS